MHRNSPITGGADVYVMAEVGINHNGSIELAHRLIDAAADAGAHAVKFQNYRTEDFISDRSLTYTYQSRGRSVCESQFDMFKRYEMIGERLAEVARHCHERGIGFCSTPTSTEGVEECVRLSACLLKNGSDYLTHLPLIRCMARTGLQAVLSTGMATGAEIAQSVEAYRSAGGRDLVLLHCISAYPAQVETMNLLRIPALSAAFDCLVGLSDHSETPLAVAGAVALGAVAIEKHFTLDKAMEGPDHHFSMTPAELRETVAVARRMRAARGTGGLDFSEIEADSRAGYRLSCVAARTLPAGHELEVADVAFRRPGTGLPPVDLPRLVGRRTRREIVAAEMLSLADLL